MIKELYITPKGGVLTLLGRSGRKLGRSYYYNVTCSFCHQDKELFPIPLEILLGKLNIGRVPCGCSAAPKWSPEQQVIRLNRKAKEIGCDLIRVLPDGNKYIKNAHSIIFCNKHKVTSKVCNQTLINGTLSGCTECGLDKKRVPISEVIKDLLKINPNYHSISIYGNSEDGNLYRARCYKCDKDPISLENYLDGYFYFGRGSVRSGCKSCRCGISMTVKESYVDILAKIDTESLGGHIEYLNYTRPFKGKDTLINYTCKYHGTQSKTWSRILEGNGCIDCGRANSSWGVVKGRELDDDNLYLFRMSNENEDFIKIGRTFDIISRHKTFSYLYNTVILYQITMTHEQVLSTEKFIHKHMQKYFKYIPNINLSRGCVSKESYTADILYEPLLGLIFNYQTP